MRITRNFRAVVFDLDDTLYPEKDYVLSGFRAVANWMDTHYGISAKATYLELKQIFENKSRSNTFDLWLIQHQLSVDKLVRHLVQVYREHLPTIQPFGEVPALLSTLKAKYRLALLSDGYLNVQRKKLSALGIASFFKTVIFSDEWGREYWKPNSRIFEITLEKLGVKGGETLYVADNPNKDFHGARMAEMQTIRLRLPSGLYSMDNPQDASYAPDLEVTSHQELSQLLLHRSNP